VLLRQLLHYPESHNFGLAAGKKTAQGKGASAIEALDAVYRYGTGGGGGGYRYGTFCRVHELKGLQGSCSSYQRAGYLLGCKQGDGNR
jgi:hypothetical protein